MDPPQPPLLVPPPLAAVAAVVPTDETPAEAAPPPTQTPSSASPPQNHVAHAANASPAQIPAFNHPPYAEMIYTAITALKERDGSSKRAIAKYIERVYSGLPPTHPALLTHHLKRLKSSGLLVMVKKSYMLPRSDTGDTGDTATADSAPDTSNTGSSTVAYSQLDQSAPGSSPTLPSASPAVGVKRGRGRPPKPKPDGFPHQAVAHPNGFPSQDNGVPFAQSANSAEPLPAFSDAAAEAATQPNSVPVGFAPDPASMEVKRGPGRPRKAVVVGQGVLGAPVAVAAKQGRGRGRPLKNGPLGPKRSPGRPRKLKSVGAIKKRPGRPPKNPQLANPVAVPYATVPVGGAAPADNPESSGVSVPTGVAVPVFNLPRPRGRPRKNAVGSVSPLQAAGGIVHARRPGRPAKLSVGIAPKRKSSGRPVGRPRKNANVSWAISEVSQKQAEAYGDLKRKLELFQTRVKEAVGALKPHLAGAAISAVVAIQELEGIASMDINTPLSLEVQPQPQIEPPQSEPQPQPQPQPQQQPSSQPQLQLQLQPPIHQDWNPR